MKIIKHTKEGLMNCWEVLREEWGSPVITKCRFCPEFYNCDNAFSSGRFASKFKSK